MKVKKFNSSAEEKREALEKYMSETMINTLNGRVSLFDLITKVGVLNKVEYFNYIEKKAPKSVRSIKNPTVTVDETHDYGLKFNDGFEIRHIDKMVFKYCSAEVLRKRERK